ncbi:MAG: hypothetical protein IPH09_04350 [bacterium]|nr:hypothetical protein [bacterium]
MGVLRHASHITINIVLILGLPALAAAQLSPGKLSRAHEKFEGVRQCTSCHELGDQTVGPKCLACHQEIATRVAAGRGLHAAAGHEQCATCHVEHQGRVFDLVHWPAGPKAFDHATAGWPLEGAHRKLECRTCHRADLLQDLSLVRDRGKNPGRTYLGLGTACLDCHRDEHRGQFERACTDCHGKDAWKPAAGFDHAKSDFKLEGKHREAACDRCHPVSTETVEGAADSWRRYRPVAHDGCADCHQDPHAGSLGDDCARCHDSASWRRVAGGAFDHDRTRYPLRGRHAALKCDACHRADAPRNSLVYARCDGCHRERHPAAADGRTFDACSRCHTVDRFAPSSFTVARHDSTNFDLTGAHLAVPCSACHAPARKGAPTPLQRPAAACTDCHRDPHAGTSTADQAESGCRLCHDASSWRAVAYDHGRTRFPLVGKHAATACRACHAPPGARAAADSLRFRPTPERCDACHKDPHRGQFAATTAPPVTDCERCHATVAGWRAVRFDHDRDTTFPLAGGHLNVACLACHPREGEGDDLAVRYRPVDKRCEACHTAGFLDTRNQGDRP